MDTILPMIENANEYSEIRQEMSAERNTSGAFVQRSNVGNSDNQGNYGKKGKYTIP